MLGMVVQFSLNRLLMFVVLVAIGLNVFLFFARDSKLKRLLNACRAGDTTSIQRLIRSGQDPTQQDVWNTSPLMMAASYGKTEAIEVLLEYGVSVDERSRFQKTPLMHAAENGQLPAVELLIRKNACVEAKDSNGSTAIKLAGADKHFDVVNLLQNAIQRKNKDPQGIGGTTGIR